MNDDNPVTAPDEAPESGLFSEDWLATIIGLVILVLALAGFIPEGLLW